MIMKERTMARRLILGMLILAIGLMWAGPVLGQDEMKMLYDDPNLAYEEALRRIEEARVNGTTQLDLINIPLEKLPPEIGQLTNLQTLQLLNIPLTTLPSEISQLSHLQRLSILSPLTSLPAEIGQLSDLKHLSIHSRALTSLPPEIGQLRQLRGDLEIPVE